MRKIKRLCARCGKPFIIELPYPEGHPFAVPVEDLDKITVGFCCKGKRGEEPIR